jgi:hypothetical protein
MVYRLPNDLLKHPPFHVSVTLTVSPYDRIVHDMLQCTAIDTQLSDEAYLSK